MLEISAQSGAVLPAGKALVALGVTPGGILVLRPQHHAHHVRLVGVHIVVHTEVEALQHIADRGVGGVGGGVTAVSIHRVAARRQLVAEHGLRVLAEFVARDEGKTRHVLRAVLLILRPVHVEAHHAFRHEGEAVMLRLPRQCQHILCACAVVGNALARRAVLVEEAVHVIQIQAALIACGIAEPAAEQRVGAAVERGGEPLVIMLAVHPHTELPAEFGFLVAVLDTDAVQRFRRQLVDEVGAFDGENLRIAGAVFTDKGGLGLTERERHGLKGALHIQLVYRGLGRTAVPCIVAVLVALLQTADIPIAEEQEVVEHLGLSPDAEAAPFIIAAAAVALGAALHAVGTAGRVKVAPLVLRAEPQVKGLHPRILRVVALGIKELETPGQPSVEIKALSTLAQAYRAHGKRHHREYVLVHLFCLFMQPRLARLRLRYSRSRRRKQAFHGKQTATPPVVEMPQRARGWEERNAHGVLNKQNGSTDASNLLGHAPSATKPFNLRALDEIARNFAVNPARRCLFSLTGFGKIEV